jgi:NAD(P)-dependent dehydrogenase (short-subunit alcohol dehydrogenase family)
MSVHNFKKVIVVTGGNRGIGSGIVEGLCQQDNITDKIIIIGCRDQLKGQNKINELLAIYPKAEKSLISLELNMLCDKSIKNFTNKVKNNFKNVNILYNNAAIMNKHKYPVPEKEKRLKDLEQTFQTNFWGLSQITENLIPVIKEGGQIIGLSTALAKIKLSKRLNEKLLDENLTLEELKILYEEYKPIFIEDKVPNSEWDDKNPIYGCYNVSKIFLNAYTILLKNRFSRIGRNIKVNCVTPGWCNTEMGGSDAPRSALKGAETCVWLESLTEEKDESLSGNLYYDKKKIKWI